MEKMTLREVVPTSVRVTPVCMRLWSELARRQGLNRTAYLETTMRRLATDAGIAWEDGEREGDPVNA